MDDQTKAGVIRRLQSVEGHVRGIQRMVEEDKYCIDVIKQIEAVQAALSKINRSSWISICAPVSPRPSAATSRTARSGDQRDS